jgi:hypothetical protein
MRLNRTRRQFRQTLYVWAAVYFCAAFATAFLYAVDYRPADPDARIVYAAAGVAGTALSTIAGLFVLLGFVVYCTADFLEPPRRY